MNSPTPALPSAEGNPVDSQLPKPDVDLEINPAPIAVALGLRDSPAHEIERVVLHRLQNHPGLKFTRLDVHRCNQNAICLEGFLESNENQIDLCEVVRGIHGITDVVNRVVTAHPPVPKKG